MKSPLAIVTLLVVSGISIGIGRTVGYDRGHDVGYLKGYQDNTYYPHGCSPPENVGDTIECHRYPMYMGKNEKGIPPVKVLVDQDLFDRWIRARDDKDEPSSGVACTINALGEVRDCNFPVG